VPRLTKRWIDSWAPTPGSEAIAWDDRMPGFGVRAYPSGRRAWLVQYRVGKATRRLVLGSLGELTQEEAHKLARTQLSAVLAGRDPSAERRALRQAATVAELCDRSSSSTQSRESAPGATTSSDSVPS